MVTLAVSIANMALLVIALRLLVNTAQRVIWVERYLRQKGLRMCYRDAEDLQRAFARKEGSRCDS